MNEAIATVDAAQIIPLRGVQNFREVGGYPTRDGGRLRRGFLWRSARLSSPTHSDLDWIRARGIASIADLRRPLERASHPTHPDLLANLRLLTWNVTRSDDEGPRRALVDPHATEGERLEALLSLYRRLPEQHAQQMQDICSAINVGAVPILIHCAAGKDRTGVVVALLLELIGVQRAYVIADYVRTEALLDWSRLTGEAAAGVGVDRSWVSQMSPDARALLFRSDPRYLTAALEFMERSAGSVEEFSIRTLGISSETIHQLRDRLVAEPT